MASHRPLPPPISASARSHRLLALLALLACAAQPAAVEHPFLLWTPEEAAAIRARIAAEPWAAAEYQTMLAPRRGNLGQTMDRLFRYAVMGDEKAGEEERAYLLSFIGAPVDQRAWSDQYWNALRYDVLHASLTEPQRADLEATFRAHVRWQIENDDRTYTRTSWLPNMQWPRVMGAHLLAVALGDVALMESIASANGGWKYYFDDYLSDGGFYNEEFGKMYSMIGEMLLWCRGCARLGVDRLGFGYLGKGGATMRSHLESIQRLGMPRVDLDTDRPHWPRLTMGDAKGAKLPGYAFQHAIVQGHLLDGSGGNPRWMGSNMNGRDHRDRIIDKMLEPLWFELAHQRWPDAGFDWFLAQMRRPDQERYLPSLYFGLAPIDPAAVQPPPAPSGLYPQRGFAVLRAEEGPAYWDAPAPAVTLRLATPYVHHVQDVFAITGFYAFNRPIFINRSAAAGYAGTDAGWSNSIRSHAAAIVDGAEPVTVGEVPTRSAFGPLAKFVAARAEGVYPGVVQERALLLTREYLVDVTRLASATPRAYQWQVHTLGHACPDRPGRWSATRHLVGTLYDLSEERSLLPGSEDWAVTAVQTSAGAEPDSGLGPSWFSRRVGVRTTMLGEPGTIAYTARWPVVAGERYRLREGADEPGGVTIAAARNAAVTTFAAVHEPFEGHHRIGEVRRIAEDARGIALAVRGAGTAVDDRVMLVYADADAQPHTFAGGGESFTCAGHAWVRVGDAQVTVEGGLAAMRLRVRGAPRLIIDGVETPATVADGWMTFGAPAPQAAEPQAAPRAPEPWGLLAARWKQPLLRLPTGGAGTATLALRNAGMVPLAGGLVLDGGALAVEPATVALERLEPGEEREMTVRIAAGGAAPNGVHAVNLAAAPGLGGDVQPAGLRVAHGIVAEPFQLWPRDVATTVIAPRYVVRYHYLRSVAAAYLLDPAGRRRFDAAGTTFPRLLRRHEQDGKASWKPLELGGYQAFAPRLRDGAAGEPRFLADMGQHPHGYRMPVEYRFDETAISVRFKDGAPDERIVIDWSSSWRDGGDRKARIVPVFADAAGGVVEQLADGAEVRAMYRPIPGFVHGEATFYPPGSVRERDLVAQPAQEAMRFTFCTREEFPDLVAQWLAAPPPVPVKPHGQGDMK